MTLTRHPSYDAQAGLNYSERAAAPDRWRGNTKQTQRRGGAMADLDLSQAQQVLDAAMQKAAEIDTLMNVAVVDAGGNLKAFGRMDGAWLGSIDISIKKARTARF